MTIDKTYREWRIQVADDDLDSSVIGPHTYGKEVNVIDIQALKDANDKITRLEKENAELRKYADDAKSLLHLKELLLTRLTTQLDIAVKAIESIKVDIKYDRLEDVILTEVEEAFRAIKAIK